MTTLKALYEAGLTRGKDIQHTNEKVKEFKNSEKPSPLLQACREAIAGMPTPVAGDGFESTEAEVKMDAKAAAADADELRRVCFLYSFEGREIGEVFYYEIAVTDDKVTITRKGECRAKVDMGCPMCTRKQSECRTCDGSY